MNIVRTKEYGQGGRYQEYGKGGAMPKQLLEYFKKKQGNSYADGGEFTGDGRPFEPGQAYVISGYENRPDAEGMVSGRERLYVAVPGEGGTRTMDLREAMKEFGYSNPVEMLKAMGIETERSGEGFIVPGAEQDDYRRRLMMALGQEGEGYRELQDRLGIGRVDYERSRDLPNLLAQPRTGM